MYKPTKINSITNQYIENGRIIYIYNRFLLNPFINCFDNKDRAICNEVIPNMEILAQNDVVLYLANKMINAQI